MKRKISILSIAVSVLVLLVFAILPHHHHEEMACLIMEFCEQDDAVNDEHTHHNEAPEEGHNGSCISESEYIVSNFNDETKCKVSSCKDYNHNHILFFPVYFLVADLLNFDIGKSCPKTEYGEYISFYKSAEATQFHGLRAPPAILT
jgi:hypothetical protein